ncbi:DUF2845 domain-containing protein [Elongatibacter sediminis]|uniref:DUF2845 domain-containing protein n=1 Tax=Elongatibacter sediminis TaxID=3119006 RepID=A0AAW9RG38_9GAMM
MARPSSVFLTVLLVMAAPPLSWSDSFRCGRKVVRDGDSAADVLSRCGEPGRRESGQASIWLPQGRKQVRVERWYYLNGPRRLERIVLLYRGRVVGVESGRRGGGS